MNPIIDNALSNLDGIISMEDSLGYLNGEEIFLSFARVLHYLLIRRDYLNNIDCDSKEKIFTAEDRKDTTIGELGIVLNLFPRNIFPILYALISKESEEKFDDVTMKLLCNVIEREIAKISNKLTLENISSEERKALVSRKKRYEFSVKLLASENSNLEV